MNKEEPKYLNGKRIYHASTVGVLVSVAIVCLDELRKAKNYELADKIRDALIEQGFQVNYDESGTRITPML